MADILESASTFVGTFLKTQMSQSVEYRRRFQKITLTATVFDQSYTTEDDFGVLIQEKMTEFIVAAVDLTFGDPQRGDVIAWTRGTKKNLYEVTSPGKGPPFEQHDHYGQRWLIHTKLTGVE